MSLSFFKTLGLMLSGPGALQGSRFFRSFCTPATMMLIGGIGGALVEGGSSSNVV